LRHDDRKGVPSGRQLYADALTIVLREGVELIRPLLKAGKEPGLSGALFVFSELTAKMAAPLVKDVIPHIRPLGPWARWELIEGLQWHSDKLSPKEIVAFLQYCGDSESNVRHKISQAIAFIPLSKLGEAATILPPSPTRDFHLEGIRLQLQPFSDDAVKAALAKSNSVLNCYVFATFYREACLERYHLIPKNYPEADREYLEGMIISKKRMNKMKLRKKKK